MKWLKVAVSFPFEGLHYKDGQLNWIFIIGSTLFVIGTIDLVYGFWLFFGKNLDESSLTAKILLAGIVSTSLGYFFRMSSKDYRNPQHKRYFDLDSKPD